MEVPTIQQCCAPLLDEVLDPDEAAVLAAGFKVLADPIRLRLLSLIASVDGGMCTCDLVEPIGRSQPTISHHLSILVEAGLLERTQRGKWAWFTVVPAGVSILRDALGVD